MPVPAEAALARAANAPVNPLIVRYRNGELTIEADNATLNDILRAVSKEIGAVIDVPSEANDLVLRHLGPGPVAGVLNALLKPSRFNYAIRASSSHGRAPVLVILSTRPAPAALARQIQNPVPAQASVGVVPAAISTAGGPTKPAGPGAPQQAQSPAAVQATAGIAAATPPEEDAAARQRQEMQDMLEQQQQTIQQGVLERLSARSGQVAEDTRPPADSPPPPDSQPQRDSPLHNRSSRRRMKALYGFWFGRYFFSTPATIR